MPGEEREHWKEQEPEAVKKRLAELLKRKRSGYFFPNICVHPDLIQKIPRSVRHDEKIAQQAWTNAVASIRQHLSEMQQERGLRKTAFELSGDFERMVKRFPSPVFFEASYTSSHLVGARIPPAESVQVYSSKDLAHNKHGHNYWYENNVSENPLSSLMLTHWVLEYQKLLAQHVQK